MKPLPQIICRGIRGYTLGYMVYRFSRNRPVNTEKLWVEGDVSYHKDGRVFIRNWDMGTYNAYEVIPRTVGVFTGYKDINDRRIFTGDLVRVTLDLGNGQRIVAESYVYFDGGCFCVNWGDQYHTFQSDDRYRARIDGFNPNNTTFEVIGDIGSIQRMPIIN